MLLCWVFAYIVGYIISAILYVIKTLWYFSLPKWDMSIMIEEDEKVQPIEQLIELLNICTYKKIRDDIKKRTLKTDKQVS